MNHQPIQPESEPGSQQFLDWKNEIAEHLNQRMFEFENLVDGNQSLDEQVDLILSQPQEQRSFLFEFSDDRDVIKALLLNINSVRGVKRKSGKMYSSHPALVGHMILKEAGDLAKRDRKHCAMVSFTHDVIEEGGGENPQKYLNSQFLDVSLGDRAIILMEPDVPKESIVDDEYTAIYCHMAEQIKSQADAANVNVEIADRLDDLTDLDYILISNKTSEDKKEKIVRKLAKARFLIDHITAGNDFASPNLLKVFNNVFDLVTSSASQSIGLPITESDIEEGLQKFRTYYDTKQQNIVANIVNYLNKKGIK